jgi:long-subunit acyl-CoA synthetase (AMP-forming)
MQTVTDLAKAPNTVGSLVPNTRALVIDSQGKGEWEHEMQQTVDRLLTQPIYHRCDLMAELGPNEAGELLLNGPQMMKGYFENEQSNKDAFEMRQGVQWLRTGDVAKIDEGGYITITDRLKDVIKASGFQVSPAELEGEYATCAAFAIVLTSVLLSSSDLVQRLQGRGCCSDRRARPKRRRGEAVGVCRSSQLTLLHRR